MGYMLLVQNMPNKQYPRHKQILESTGTLKIGLSLKDDFAGLRRLSPIIPHHYIELQQYATAFGIEEMSLQKFMHFFSGEKFQKHNNYPTGKLRN